MYPDFMGALPVRACQWQAPKTSWSAEDAFRLDPDYERIRDNLLYLQQRAAAITQKPGYSQMQDYAVDGVPLADFFNRVEENLAALADAVQPRPEYSTRSFSHTRLPGPGAHRGDAAADLQRSERNRERPAEAGFLFGRWLFWHVCFVI